MNIKTVNAIYTGGSIWIFFGQVDNNFFMMDDNGCVLILDTDPQADLDNCFYPEWQEQHTIKELMDEERTTFLDKALDQLLSEDEETRGYITDEEIESYRIYFKED